MNEFNTNRDLYLMIAGLLETEKSSPRSLEEYLRALWHHGKEYRQHEALLLADFGRLLSDAFRGTVPPFDEAWRSRYDQDGPNIAGFSGWETRILRQLVDLHEMAEEGLLENEYRDFGIDSPRGERWFNFDPRAFLECACQGTFGGWRVGDNTGRAPVPGSVAVLADDGRIESRDPGEIEDDEFPISRVTWETFTEFLSCGQLYE